jgi:hypothetical protein
MTVADRIDEVLALPQAVALVEEYFDRDGPFAADTFDALRPNSRNAFGVDDLLAVTFLGVVVPPLAARRILGADAPHLTARLTAIRSDVDLWDDAADDSLAAAHALWDDLDAYSSVGEVIAGKLLARKRPRLVPIVDSVVAKALGAERGTYWETMRHCLADPGRRQRIEDLRPPHLAPSSVTTLRLLDVALWMRYSEGKYARKRRAALGLEVIPRTPPRRG